ncbi:MAG: PhnD/SsuA/transferrin family substrate-binding protein [Pseudonocardiaceae bacterium]|nr:PhnD/SsuA/transferrin family substrate-binding protein [Pseudonocardiaceae bacterium]
MTRRRICAGLAALVVAGATGACSNAGGDLSAGTAGSGGEGGGGGGAGMRQITVAETAGTPLAFITYGVQRGFFEQQGLDVNAEASTGGATVIPSLLSGDIDVAGSNMVSVMIAQSQGVPVTMVAAGTSTAQDPENDFSGVLVRGDSPIQRPQDLAGKRIAVNTLKNINDVVIFSALSQRGVDISGVELIEMPFPDMAAAVQRGDVDAGMLIEPFLTQGRAQGLRPVLAPYSDLRPGLQIGTYAMTDQRIAEDPELMQRFQRGVQQTADAIRADPQAFRTALPEIAEFDPDLAQRVNLPQWRGRTDRASVELIKDGMLRYGLIESDLAYDDIVRY